MGSAFYFFDETRINRWFWVVTQKCELRVSFNGRDFREQKCFWDKFSQLAGLKTEKFEEIIFVIGSFMWTSRNYLWDGKIWKVSVGDNYEIEIIHIFFFSIRIFFHGHWRLTGQQGKGEDYLLFHSTTSTRSRTFRHLFATLHVRWLSHIFNRIACIYQTATRWDLLPPYRIAIWLIDDVAFVFVCLRDDLFLAFFATAIWEEKSVDSNSRLSQFQ